MTDLAPYHKRYRRDRALLGPSEVDSRPFVAVLRYARRAGISLAEIGIDRHYLQDGWTPDKMRRSTRNRLLANVNRVLAERQDALDDCRSALAYACGDNPEICGEWPSAPLRELVAQRGLSVNAALTGTDRRYLYRSERLDTARAERMCAAFDLAGELVWPDWWQR